MSARDEIAKLLFIIDNAGAPDPETEWERCKTSYPLNVEYVYFMADALIDAGYRKVVTKPVEIPVLPGQDTIDTALGA